MSERRTYLSGDDIKDAKNARGFSVPWERIAAHHGVSVDEMKQACGEPQWKSEPAATSDDFDLFASERLDAVL